MKNFGKNSLVLPYVVLKAPKSSHISPILKSFHWLKIYESI